MIKNLPAMQETWIRGWEDPLEKGMATHSTVLAWTVPWTEEPGELQSTTERLILSLAHTPCPSPGDLPSPGIKTRSPAV